MKKVLLTSTALVMTAGFAYAEVSAGVSLSGSAEIGVKDVDDDSDIQFHNDLDLDINFAGETDGGLAFGASIDLDEVNNGISADRGPAAAFISYNGFRLDMGDVDGAFDLVNLETTLFTSINDDHTSHGGYNGGDGLDGSLDGQIATFSYTGVPGLLLAASAEIGDGADDDEIYGVGIRYTYDLASVSLTGSIGYQNGTYDFGAALSDSQFDNVVGPALAGSDFTDIEISSNDADIWGVSFEAEFDMGLTARVNYSTLDSNIDSFSFSVAQPALDVSGIGVGPFVPVNDVTFNQDNLAIAGGGDDLSWDHWSIVVGYETGPFAVEVNYGKYDNVDIGPISTDADGWGLAFMYDLGGGAVAQVGYGSGDNFAGDTTDTWSAGLALSF